MQLCTPAAVPTLSAGISRLITSSNPFHSLGTSLLGALCQAKSGWLVAWHSGRTSVFGRRTFPVLRSTCRWRVTIYVGKPSAIGQPNRFCCFYWLLTGDDAARCSAADRQSSTNRQLGHASPASFHRLPDHVGGSWTEQQHSSTNSPTAAGSSAAAKWARQWKTCYIYSCAVWCPTEHWRTLSRS